MSLNQTGIKEKGWGFENIWISNEHYCSKYMKFKPYSEFSMHFHANKIESWLVTEGIFELETIDTKNAVTSVRILNPGDTWTNHTLSPHRLRCISVDGGVVLEVSTPDHVEDNYRVAPGDSQL